MNLYKISAFIFILILCSTQISNAMTAQQRSDYFDQDYGKQLKKANHHSLTSASSGKIDLVKETISQGANVNYRDCDSENTPLYKATLNNHLDIIKLLIENRANSNLKGPDGITPLSLAATKGNLDIVSILMANGADENATTYYNLIRHENMNAIKIAEAYGHNTVANYIREYKANREKELQEATSLLADIVNIVEEYEGYKKPKHEKKYENQ